MRSAAAATAAASAVPAVEGVPYVLGTTCSAGADDDDDDDDDDDARRAAAAAAAAGKADARGSETRVLGRESAEQKTLERALRVAMALRRSHCRAPLQSIDRGEARRGVRIKRDPILVEADVDREPFACRKGHTPGRGARARARTQTRANSRQRAREKTLPPRARARTRAASRADGVSEEAKKRANLFFGIAVNLIGLASRG